MNVSEQNRWLRARRPLARPRVRLLCLPYAGGGASIFHAWPDRLPADIEVYAAQLPGRQDRLSEPALTSLAEIVARLVSALSLLPPAPLALYGHSFGALTAFELARTLRAAGQLPVSLIVSARCAPQLPPAATSIHQLSTPAFKEELHRRYGTPRAVLQDDDLMSIVLPSLRADLAALETYTYVAGEPLDCPVTILHAKHDPLVSINEATAWSEITAGPVWLHEIDAGHFFVDTHRAWVLAQVAEACQA